MSYKVTAVPVKKMAVRGKQTLGRGASYPLGGVSELSLPARNMDQKVEQMFSEIVTRLERIEEKIDENVYPPESAIKPEFIRQVKKAEAGIRKGKGKTYESMDAFIKAISE
ncbi:MAG: hypothetical protein LUQ71_06950 [Methanoregula sp.]|nr:hypothetical protein [Methanoregula sp.]